MTNFLSPKRKFYFNVEKETSAGAFNCPPDPIPGLRPWTPLTRDSRSPDPLICPRNRGDRSTPVKVLDKRHSVLKKM